eukprot:927064-Pleurochrysis_carterae.AAC.1
MNLVPFLDFSASLLFCLTSSALLFTRASAFSLHVPARAFLTISCHVACSHCRAEPQQRVVVLELLLLFLTLLDQLCLRQQRRPAARLVCPLKLAQHLAPASTQQANDAHDLYVSTV